MNGVAWDGSRRVARRRVSRLLNLAHHLAPPSSTVGLEPYHPVSAPEGCLLLYLALYLPILGAISAARLRLCYRISRL